MLPAMRQRLSRLGKCTERKDAVTKTPGQLAYERDLQHTPLYHDGTPRPTWEQLRPVAQWTWERNPTDRFITQPVTHL